MEYDINQLTVYSDSELLVNQINGKYKIKKPHLRALYEKIQDIVHSANIQLSIHHIPREVNNEADGLARRAVDARSVVDG